MTENRTSAEDSAPEAAHSPTHSSLSAGERQTSLVGNFIRGALMGAVETVPGTSAGTIALVVGIYGRILDSASHAVSAVRRFITGPNRWQSAKEHLALMDWKLLVPLLIGMVGAVFTLAGPISHLVETQPELTRAAFFGMVLASTSVPLRMAGVTLIRWYDVAAGIAAGALAFWLVSLPPASVDQNPLIIIGAAALAVCALLLPGLSGMFVILTFGLYETTLNAVATLDFGYLGIFAVGMLIGLLSIVKGLQWLLVHRRRITLVVLTGVMVGAIRSLWPWQSDARALEVPGGNWPMALLIGAIGFAVVAVLSYVDARLTNKQLAQASAQKTLADDGR